MRPVIGIPSNFAVNHETPPREHAYLLAAYVDAIVAVGGLPSVIPALASFNNGVLDELLARHDALLFTGGLDLDPANYDAPIHPQTTTLHPRRERFELALFHHADAARTPMLCICLGLQLAHVARGGGLLQHVDDLDRTPRVTHHLDTDENAFHDVEIAPDSRLAQAVNADRIEVNSRHHQIIDPAHLGRGLRNTAFAPDGVIEASEDFDGRFLLAVQWHPEDLVDRPEHRALFAALVDAAGQHRDSRKA